MRVQGLTYLKLHVALDAVNEIYQGNLAFRESPYFASSHNMWMCTTHRVAYERWKNYKVRLMVVSLDGPGVRWVAPRDRDVRTPRRLRLPCYHAHRDWALAVYEFSPLSIIGMTLAGRRVEYRGRADFEANYPAMGAVKVGSMSEPSAFAEACYCREFGDPDRRSEEFMRWLEAEGTERFIRKFGDKGKAKVEQAIAEKEEERRQRYGR